MSQAERKYHESWMGMVQPIDGLVFSVPVLVDAQVMDRTGSIERQERLLAVCDEGEGDADDDEGRLFLGVEGLLFDVLGYRASDFDRAGEDGKGLPEELSLWVPEGRQSIRPTLALKKLAVQAEAEASDGELEGIPDDSTPQSRAGSAYEMLVWEVPRGLDLDRPETVTGTWEYPVSAKFDRLLRVVRVPMGLLTNGEVVRLVYAPHGESSGSMNFRVDEMATVGGRPILDALDAVLCAERVIGMQGADDWPLSRILAESRKRQANVTNQLADQLYDALEVLLHGFEQAAERDGWDSLRDALGRDDDHVYGGLLTVLLRLVFVLYAEDRGLLPVDQKIYAKDLSVLALFEELQEDNGTYPDSMGQRFGAWPRLVALFRAIFLGVKHGGFSMPARRGQLFDPNEYPFLEGWRAGSAPIKLAEHRAATRVPSVDDGTIFRVLHELLVLDRHRLSYRALDVEQIGSVYEALMGYHVVRLASDAVCLKAAKARGGVWVQVQDVLDVAAARRDAFIRDETGLAKSALKKVSKELKAAEDDEGVIEALGPLRRKGSILQKVGHLVIQPGKERRRTSSHYTPPSLTTPIVKRTLEPLLKVMGDEPASERLLNLKICDPAMGSGAFLVSVVKFLADQVVAAWTREGKVEEIAHESEDVVHVARRLVAQRCVYGVDKNRYAVNLAKLSLWLTTLAKDEPFTFLDHALRHGDSLVGLDLEQLRGFTWEKGEATEQEDWCARAIAGGLEESMAHRREILALAAAKTPEEAREKERLLQDAEFAIGRARLLADVIVGAFFAESKPKARKEELARRMALVQTWLETDELPGMELRAMQAAVREQTPVFHWPLDFPEVFWEGRPDPLDDDQVNRAADMDAFVGNPPFLGGSKISGALGSNYRDWLSSRHSAANGRADICAHFFWRHFVLLGTHGSLGFLATDSISQGDTRDAGLRPIVGSGGRIYTARRRFRWPGEASVSVAAVHIAKGHLLSGLPQFVQLDGELVATISSGLRSSIERDDPRPLNSNVGLVFQGSKLNGIGFVLNAQERDALLEADASNSEIIMPYIGGGEFNSSPIQEHSRWAINFRDRTLSEASAWPLLLQRVRELVKPARDRVKDNTGKGGHGKKYWWQYVDRCDPLYEGLEPLKRCLVLARDPKHFCFAFQPKYRVFNQKLCIF